MSSPAEGRWSDVSYRRFLGAATGENAVHTAFLLSMLDRFLFRGAMQSMYRSNWVLLLAAMIVGLMSGAMARAGDPKRSVSAKDVQRGLRSRTYRAGRFSVRREEPVYLFHRLLARYLRQGLESDK